MLKIRTIVVSLILFLSASIVFAQEGRWLQRNQHGSIAYFLSGAPAEIARYDLSTKTFLAPILLSLPPTAFTVDDDGIYVAFTQTMARMDLDGSNYMPLANAVGTVRELVTFGNNLYGSVPGTSPNFIRIDKTIGGILELPDFFYTMNGISVSPATLKIFGRSSGVSPADILQVQLAADGAVGAQNDSPYHGDYPGATAAFVFPDQTRVVDDAGIVYYTADLTYAGSLSGSFDHVAFHNDEPLVLRGDKVVRYSTALLAGGESTLANPVHSVFAFGGDLFGFYNDSLGDLALEIVDISTLKPPDPGDPVDPDGLVYTPDAAVAANDGTILLLSKANLSIFRWSPAESAYTQSIPLANVPVHFAYSAINDRVYLGYDDGQISQVDMTTGLETPFANVPSNVLGLAVADPYVFAVDPAGAWVSHFTFDQYGVLISQEEWNYYSQDYVWNAANRKMYFLRDGTSPNDLLWEDIDVNGVIGNKMDSPYHSSTGIQHPIRVAASGSYVLLGSGRIYNALTLELLNSIPNDVEDARWRSDGSIAAIRDAGGFLQLQEINRSYFDQSTVNMPGAFGRLVLEGQDVHIIWDNGGIPRFQLWNWGIGDIDDDGVGNGDDDFALDPTETTDTDGDGIGNNADTDDDNDGVLDSQFADITAFIDVTGDAVPDVATFVDRTSGKPRIGVYSGANGDLDATIEFINDKWRGIALATVRNANQDGTSDDPAVAMLNVNKTTGKIRVETRQLSNSTFLGSIQYFNENWRAIDVVVIDDLNGDGNTNDTAIAVLAERYSDGRIQLQLRDFVSGALIANTLYLNTRWTPFAAAVANRPGMTPVIGVIAHNTQNNKRTMQVREAGSGNFDQNIKFLGSTWDYQDVSVNHDANGDGTADDPVWLVLAVRPADNVIRVQSKFVADGAFHDNIVILNSNWESFRFDNARDISDNNAEEMVISAIRRSDGVRRIHIKDFGDGSTTINIAP